MDQDLALLLITKALVKFLGVSEGVIVEHDGLKYSVYFNGETVTVDKAPEKVEEGNRICYCVDKADAVTRAALDPNGVFIDDSVNAQVACDFFEDGVCTNPEIEVGEVSEEFCEVCEANTALR